ncbi:hypothetical protein V6Z11_D11G314200, partial [Gossypium hirsutum]
TTILCIGLSSSTQSLIFMNHRHFILHGFFLTFKDSSLKVKVSSERKRAKMERKSCCGYRSYLCTPKKEAMVTPKKEEDVKPDVTKGNHQAAPVPVPAAVVKRPKKEENETVK